MWPLACWCKKIAFSITSCCDFPMTSSVPSSSFFATSSNESLLHSSLQMIVHFVKRAGFYEQWAWNLECLWSRLSTIERFFLTLLTKNSNTVLYSYDSAISSLIAFKIGSSSSGEYRPGTSPAEIRELIWVKKSSWRSWWSSIKRTVFYVSTPAFSIATLRSRLNSFIP
jgi:hypothetical protein